MCYSEYQSFYLTFHVISVAGQVMMTFSEDDFIEVNITVYKLNSVHVHVTNHIRM